MPPSPLRLASWSSRNQTRAADQIALKQMTFQNV